jgi:hypothetical protein
MVRSLGTLDRRLERSLRRLREIDDATFRRGVLSRLVRDARRLVQLALHVAAAGPSADAAVLRQLVADAQVAVGAYVRLCVAELRGQLRHARTNA